ncbi:MAG: riboflavin kinase [Actinomycetota bacterium]
MLGRWFEARGPVVDGDHRGRTIGFATANVQVPGFICLPADGVYAGVYTRPDGSRWACAINLGRRRPAHAPRTNGRACATQSQRRHPSAHDGSQSN